MKLLFLGLAPAVVFWLFEERFGTLWGIIASVVYAICECVYEYVRYRKVEKLTLFSTGLIVVLGGIGLLLDNSILFKFQPAILGVVMAGIIFWGDRGGEPMLLKLAKQKKPEAFKNLTPEMETFQHNLMKRLSRNLIVMLLALSVLLSYVAVKGTTRQWVFWKGIGINILLLFWMGGEVLIMRRKSIVGFLKSLKFRYWR